MNVQETPTAAPRHTPLQHSIRRRAGKLHLEGAVRLAADAFFHFTHRSKRAPALWCQRERVWLGSITYLNWAMSDAEIDMPWLVAPVVDAPETNEELCEAIRAVLAGYWAEQVTSLPSKSTPRWLPLP